MFEQEVARYELQVKALKNLVQPLKGEDLEALLGSDLHQELVLPEGIGRVEAVGEGGSLARKRLAEDEGGDNFEKRRKVAE